MKCRNSLVKRDAKFSDAVENCKTIKFARTRAVWPISLGLVIYEYDNKLFTDNCVALWAPIYGRVLVKYRPYSSYMMLRYVETSEAF